MPATSSEYAPGVVAECTRVTYWPVQPTLAIGLASPRSPDPRAAGGAGGCGDGGVWVTVCCTMLVTTTVPGGGAAGEDADAGDEAGDDAGDEEGEDGALPAEVVTATAP